MISIPTLPATAGVQAFEYRSGQITPIEDPIPDADNTRDALENAGFFLVKSLGSEHEDQPFCEIFEGVPRSGFMYAFSLFPFGDLGSSVYVRDPLSALELEDRIATLIDRRSHSHRNEVRR